MSFAVVSSGVRTEVNFDDGGVNRLTRARLTELTSIVREAPAATRLLVLRSGRRGIFAAGADMEEMMKFAPADAESFSRAGQELMSALEGADFATAAVIDGNCHGGAFDLALSFDIRITTGRGRFAHPGARLGIMTGFGGTARFPRKLGTPAAGAVLLGGTSLDAHGAMAAGVADFLVEEDDTALEKILVSCEANAGRIAVARKLAAAAPALDDLQLSVLARRLTRIAQYN